MSYNNVLNRIGLYNTPVNIDGVWFIRTKGSFLGSKDSLYEMGLTEVVCGLVPVWVHRGDVNGTSISYSITTS